MSRPDLPDLPLRERIRWLRENSPHGRLSHDRLAAALGTTRQTVIGWEKGARPKQRYIAALAEFFGEPQEIFTAPAAEAVTLARVARRLEELEASFEELRPFLPLLGDLQQQLDDLARRVAAAEQRGRAGKGRGGSAEGSAL